MTTHLTLPRFDADIVLQAETDAPVHVGSHATGNISMMWRSEFKVHDPHAPESRRWRTIKVPGIPGRSLRGVLRDLAMSRFCEIAGIATDDRDVLRLLFKGGKLDKSQGGVDLSTMQWLRENCPPLALFGCMDNIASARALLQVEDLLAWTSEGVASGRQARVVRVHDPDGTRQDIDLFPGLGPIPVADCSGEETGYRRDLMQSGAAHRLGPEGRKAIEARAGEVRAARMALAAASRHGEQLTDDPRAVLSKESRREANESMPWTVECIPRGVPLLGRIRALGVTEVEYACLALTLADWARLGCPVGGKTSSGFGKLRLLSAPTVRLDLSPGVLHAAGRLVPDGLAPGEAEINAYMTWVWDRAPDIRAWAGVKDGAA